MKYYLTILLIPILVMPLFAQKLDIFGYFEPQFTFMWLKTGSSQLQSDKIRIDLASRLGDHVAIGADFEVIKYYGTTFWSYYEFLPDKLIPQPDSIHYWVPNIYFPDVSDWGDIYARLSYKQADLTVGKQQLSFGTGYAWNPTDVFNTKDVLDPTYEQTGHNALRLDISIGSRNGITALYQPEYIWDSSTKLVRVRTGISRFDVSAIAVEQQYVSTYFGPYGTSYFYYRRHLFGGDMVGQLLGLGVWSEYAYNDLQDTDDFVEFLVGGDYTFNSGLHVLGEYYRNTQGKSNKDLYTFQDWMRWVSGNSRALSRDQAYVLADYPATDLLQVGGAIVGSLNDYSFTVVPTIIYSLFQNVELTFFGNVSTGKEGTAYSASGANSVILRLRAYFNANTR
jgi:hypothetical protein